VSRYRPPPRHAISISKPWTPNRKNISWELRLFNIVSESKYTGFCRKREVRARINLAEGQVNFDRAMGRTLEVYNITIADANRPYAKGHTDPRHVCFGQLFVDRVKQPASSTASANSSAGTGNGQ